MKLVVDFMTPKRVNKFARLLRRKGIPSIVGISRVGHHPNRFSWGQRTYGVWVLVRDQYDDAFNLAQGEDVDVSNPFSDEEMKEIEFIAARKGRNKIVREISLFIVVVIVVLVVIHRAS